ncbi:hypothetical protein JOF29_005642 [Kribbella aluminosa]|uniref:Uncharacterized protein n=1 Tax=Kribbella aluminosa TaxID=416017 RepID=A0ABS4USB2_9ACTN|nr:hypothetical protein [Kribbella aluminosa]MBP2354532.1 hypothetical protein [Kribbella aluminosa]
MTRNHLQVLGEHLQVALGETPPARWMGDQVAIDAAITTTLQDFPTKLADLHHLAAAVR